MSKLVKSFPNNKKGKLAKVICLACCLALLASAPAYAAADVNKVVSGISQLKTLFFSVIGGVGAIIAAKGIMETAQGYQQQDSSSMNAGIKSIVAGGLMAAVGTLVALFV